MSVISSRGIVIDEDLSLVGGEEKLKASPRHSVNEEHIRYRREHYLSTDD